MTVEETKKKAQVMLAWAEGRTIQCRECGKSSWYTMPKPEDDLCKVAEWDFSNYEYRVKPEPHYRPFESAEEVMEAIKEHGTLVREKDRKVISTILRFEDNYIKLATTAHNFSGAFKTLIFTDGTPFGKLVDESNYGGIPIIKEYGE